MAFFLMPSRLWELMSGALLSVLVTSYAPLYERWLASQTATIVAVELVCASLMAVALFSTDPVAGFPFPGALLAVGSTLGLITTGACAPRELRISCPSHRSIRVPLVAELLAWGSPVYIGRLSYPIYLWHWPIIVVTRFTVGPRAMHDAGALLTTISLTLLASAFTYHCIEAPFRGSLRKMTPRCTLATFLPLGCLVAAFLFALRGPLYGRLYAIHPLPFEATLGTSPWTSLISMSQSPACECRACVRTWHMPPGASAASNASDCCFEPPSAPEHLADPCFPMWVYGYGAAAIRELVSQCLTPNRSAPSRRALFLVGDSHAYDKAEALRRALGDEATLVALGTFFGCGYSPHSFHADAIRLHSRPKLPASAVADCDRFNEEINRALREQLRPGDVVAVATGLVRYQSLRLKPGNLAAEVAQQALHQERYLKALHANITSPRGTKLLLIGDQPQLRDWSSGKDTRRTCLPSGLSSGGLSPCGIDWQSALSDSSLVRQAYQRLVMEEGIFLFDTLGLFCGADGVCGPFIPGTDIVAYSDYNHLTPAGADYSAPFWCAFFRNSGIL